MGRTLSVRKKDITVTHPSSPAPLPYEEHDLSPCLITVDVSDDLSGASLQLDVRMSCLSGAAHLYN